MRPVWKSGWTWNISGKRPITVTSKQAATSTSTRRHHERGIASDAGVTVGACGKARLSSGTFTSVRFQAPMRSPASGFN